MNLYSDLITRILSVVMVISILGCGGSTPKGIATVKPFDAKRYAGLWYEIARLDHRFERGLTNVTA